ncbi:MAG: DUF4440 domain-containing protein [Shewanella sp.]
MKYLSKSLLYLTCFSIGVLFSLPSYAQTQVSEAEVNASNLDLDDKLNRHYKILTEAFERLDSKAVATMYTQDAVFIPENSSTSIMIGQQAISAHYQDFFNKVTQKNAKVEIDFRVLMRQYQTGSITDNGYYLVSYIPAPETGDAPTHFAGKFVLQFILQQQQWLIQTEASLRADSSLYYQTTQQQNWYHGRQFQP